MRELAIQFFHFIATAARLLGPGGYEPQKARPSSGWARGVELRQDRDIAEVQLAEHRGISQQTLAHKAG